MTPHHEREIRERKMERDLTSFFGGIENVETENMRWLRLATERLERLNNER